MYTHINKSGCLNTSALKDSILEHETAAEVIQWQDLFKY